MKSATSLNQNQTMKKTAIIILFSIAGMRLFAQNVFVTNDANHPIPITGGAAGGGDASAANQTAVQANAGSDATKAISIQGITSGKAVPVSSTTLSTAAKQPALGTAGTASSDVITIQGIASMTKLLVTPDANSAVNVAQVNGVTPLMGAGNTGTGSPRVTIATDQAQVNTKRLVASSTNGQVTAGSAGTLVAANAARSKLTVRNMDTSISVYIGEATVTTGNGFLLKAGESMIIESPELIQVLAASGSPVVCYIDESY